MIGHSASTPMGRQRRVLRVRPRWSLACVGMMAVAAVGAVAPAGAPADAAPPVGSVGAAAAVAGEPQPGSYTGLGFDACAAPSADAMRAWLASPYRAVGVYFGGVNRACEQPNLTPQWVVDQQAAGWHLMPIYLGLQATCTTSSKRYRIDNSRAAAQGREAAEDAVARAQALGLARESVLIYDMEAYRTDDAACRAGVLAFVSAWSSRLHDLGYLSGFYSSLSSGVADQVRVYPDPAYVSPDVLDFARWDGVATVEHPDIPGSYWALHRRIKQYRGGHAETYGGVTINIDNDYLDVAPLPATPFGDFGGNGWSDVVARGADGRLHAYAGNGTNLRGADRRVIGAGWGGMSAVVRHGDFTGDGFEDVIARQRSTGDLYLYRGNGVSLLSGVRIGVQWNGMREITAVGDFTGDGHPDLVAARTSDGNLYLYPGRGDGLGARVLVGSQWGGMDELVGPGDVDGDGRPDLVARKTGTGELFLYPWHGARFGARVRIGTGWSGMRDLTGVGDFNRDGDVDLVTVRRSTGELFLYPRRAGGWAPRSLIGTGWTGMAPLA